MLNTKSNIKSLCLQNKTLKTGVFILSTFLFIICHADSSQGDESINESKMENPYFLDIDTLQSLRTRRCFQESMYIEKKDLNITWIAFPIESRMRDYRNAVTGVVAAELHRRIDKNAMVPPTKFVITKPKDDHGYKLMGYVYQEIPFAEPIQQVRKQSGFNDYVNHQIYKNHNIEHHVLAWNILGLSMSPYYGRLAVSDDNRLVRYDYFEAFRHNNTNVDEKCFYTSDFPVNSYRCDIGYIKNLKQEQYERYRAALKTVIDDIRTAASQYLSEDGQEDLNSVLEDILANF